MQGFHGADEVLTVQPFTAQQVALGRIAQKETLSVTSYLEHAGVKSTGRPGLRRSPAMFTSAAGNTHHGTAQGSVCPI